MSSQRDADATRARILKAASAEFAERGIAGARVDRIAELADANKAMIYRYFGNKDALFDTVFSNEVIAFADAVAFTADDLPAYAGRLFDAYHERPEALRLSHWYTLERPDSTPLEALIRTNEAKVEAIADALRRGQISSPFTARELFVLVRSIAMAWDNLTFRLLAEQQSIESRRRAVVAGVEKLLR